jgi:hypothetical protein
MFSHKEEPQSAPTVIRAIEINYGQLRRLGKTYIGNGVWLTDQQWMDDVINEKFQNFRTKWYYNRFKFWWKQEYRLLTQTSKHFKRLRKRDMAAKAHIYQYDAISLVDYLSDKAYMFLRLLDYAREKNRNLKHNSK